MVKLQAFRDMKISRKFSAAIAIIITMMIISAGIAIYQVNQINNSLSVVNDFNSVKQRYAINFRGSVHDRAIELRDVVLFDNPDERRAAVATIERLEAFYADSAAPMDAIFAQSDSITAEERRILGEIKRVEAETLPLISEVIDRMSAGQTETAHEVLMYQARPLFIEWLAVINQFIDYQEAANLAEGGKAAAGASGFMALALGILAVSLVLGGLAAWSALSAIHPLSGATAAMRRLADGDHDIEIPQAQSRCEVGQILSSLHVFRGAAKEAEAARQQAAEAETREAEARAQSRRQMADDFESSVGGLIGRINDSISATKAAAETMSGTVSSVSKSAGMIEQHTTESSEHVQNAASAAEELTRSLSEITAQVTESSKAVQGVSRDAESTVSQINSLKEAAVGINDVIQLIEAIAEQTNLLALNATIEAARAGDAGKGFAVVASEVKALASQTTNATSDISKRIQQIQAETGAAVAAIDAINTSIRSTEQVFLAMTSAMDEQALATNEIARSVSIAAESSSTVGRQVQDVTGSAQNADSSARDMVASITAVTADAAALRTSMQSILDELRAA